LSRSALAKELNRGTVTLVLELRQTTEHSSPEADESADLDNHLPNLSRIQPHCGAVWYEPIILVGFKQGPAPNQPRRSFHHPFACIHHRQRQGSPRRETECCKEVRFAKDAIQSFRDAEWYYLKIGECSEDPSVVAWAIAKQARPRAITLTI
jgi:hypothetical protein